MLYVRTLEHLRCHGQHLRLRHLRRKIRRQGRRRNARRIRVRLEIQPPHRAHLRIRRRPRALVPAISAPLPRMLGGYPRPERPMSRVRALRLVDALVHIRLHRRVIHPGDPQQIAQPGILDLRVVEGASLQLRLPTRGVRCGYALLEVGEVFLPASARAALIVLLKKYINYVCRSKPRRGRIQYPYPFLLLLLAGFRARVYSVRDVRLAHTVGHDDIGNLTMERKAIFAMACKPCFYSLCPRYARPKCMLMWTL
jgi:hypothetical protein